MTSPTAMREGVVEVSRWWWTWLVAGILWILVALVILQFDSASVRTIGVIVGVMLFIAGLQYLFVGMIAEGWRWVWLIFGFVLMVAGLGAMFNPVSAFASLADMLGFLFGLVAVVWIVEALAVKESNPLWWLGLISGIMMLIIAFWASGQFLFDKAYTLLVFAGVWAILKGFLDVIQAFQIRSLGRIASDF